jgi:hypothetical protein
MESPFVRVPASSLTEQRIREIIREELQEVWDLEHVAREAASHAIDSLLHRLDRRDRQWQQEFVPHAVDLISCSVISSLDTAKSHRDMPDATEEDHVDPSRTEGVNNSSPSGKAAGIQPHTTPPGRSTDDMTTFLTPGDKIEEPFATGVNEAFAKSAGRLKDVVQTLSPMSVLRVSVMMHYWPSLRQPIQLWILSIVLEMSGIRIVRMRRLEYSLTPFGRTRRESPLPLPISIAPNEGIQFHLSFGPSNSGLALRLPTTLTRLRKILLLLQPRPLLQPLR